MKPLRHSRRTPGRCSRLHRASLATVLTLAFMDAHAQSASPLQSKARPFNLEIVGPVMSAGSDTASATFQKSALPELTAYLNATLEERKGLDTTAFSLDPSKLLLRTESDVRVYFIGDGASYQNTLGFNTGVYATPESESNVKQSGDNPKGKDSDKEEDKDKDNDKDKSKETGKDKDKDKNQVGSDDKGKEDDGKAGSDADGTQAPYAVGKDGKLIFPDASSPITFFDPAANATRREAAPLLPGDFVDLGRFDSGSQLDFFLIANGAAGGTTTYSTQSSLNADGINHVVAFAYGLKDSPYIILGFEDLYGGGDQDYNDVLFAIDVGRLNLTALTATPEPSTLLVLGCLLPFGYYLKRRMDIRSAQAP